MSLSARVRRHPFRWFYGIALGFSTVLWTYAVIHTVLWPNYAGPGVTLGDYFYAERAKVAAAHPYWAAHSDGVPISLMGYWQVPQVSMFLFFPGAPTVAALLVTGIGWGRRGVGALLSLYRPILGDQGWREAVRLYAALVLIIAGVAGLCAAAAFFMAGSAAKGVVASAYGMASLPMFLSAWGIALLMNQGGLLEEMGWRGFGWPTLARKLATPLSAAVVLGVCWALWHFPREVPLLLTGQNTLSNLLLGQSRFILACVSMTIVAVYFVNMAGGSVWPAIMVHGTFNMIYGALKLGPDGNGGGGSVFNETLWVWVIGAVIVLLISGKDLGWSTRLRLHGGDGRTDPSRLWSERESNTHGQ
ncbi:CPBP family intramembrane glutamic endopeptidase [Novosphingobium sp.]|uniref:CPBP family intramembrane glutamic endopeptidase n=1 Tax=Novosphingobium sp. TaxID=1874826 RepID=UPI0026243B3A|nr:CPBP family intramembrane glutamic endopeptidase [Novosphingobium sp.]